MVQSNRVRPFATAIVVVTLVTAVASYPLPLPMAAATSHRERAAQPTAGPEQLTLDQALDRTRSVARIDDRWVLGSFGSRRTALDVPSDARVATALGRVAGSVYEDGASTVFLVDPDTEARTDLAVIEGRVGQAVPDPTGAVAYAVAPMGPDGQDGGVIRIDAEGASFAVAPHSRDGWGRDTVIWSTDGTTLASPTCDGADGGRCMVDVLDLATGASKEVGPFGLRRVSSQALLGSDARDGGGLRPWMLLGLGDGRLSTLAVGAIDVGAEGWWLDADRLLLAGVTADRSEYRVVVADAGTGSVVRTLRSEPYGDGTLALRYPLASPRWALLWDGAGDPPSDATLQVLDTETGQVVVEVTVDPGGAAGGD